MKKVFIAVILLFVALGLYCQEGSTTGTAPMQEPLVYKASLGIDGGLNYEGLVALSAEVNIVKNICLNGAIGMGGWGAKYTIGGRFYSSYPKGIFYGVSYSHSTGLDSLAIKMDTDKPGGTQDVSLRLNPANNINLNLGYQWKLGNRFRFHLEMGYSIPLEKEPWDVLTQNITLSDASKISMNLMAPGGLMLGLGFSVGLY